MLQAKLKDCKDELDRLNVRAAAATETGEPAGAPLEELPPIWKRSHLSGTLASQRALSRPGSGVRSPGLFLLRGTSRLVRGQRFLFTGVPNPPVKLVREALAVGGERGSVVSCSIFLVCRQVLKHISQYKSVAG